jgi:hypothetical protein
MEGNTIAMIRTHLDTVGQAMLRSGGEPIPANPPIAVNRVGVALVLDFMSVCRSTLGDLQILTIIVLVVGLLLVIVCMGLLVIRDRHQRYPIALRLQVN